MSDRDDVSTLSMLGSNETKYSYSEPSKEMLETFPNKYPGHDYVATYTFPEFTSLCPKTGQPDFAEITIEYVPDKLCVESKSLKLYFFSFRQYGSFMETITNKVFCDFVAACHPRWCRVTGAFNARGGLKIDVVVEHDYR